jgi:hypothetical protein
MKRQMSLLQGLTLVSLALGATALQTDVVTASPRVRPAFVGCRSDGQVGPLPAPKSASQIPRLPRKLAHRLAYYASQYASVLAPRRWHCFGLYGSNGKSLFVTPEKHGKDLLEPNQTLSGPAIQLSVSDGETSGRFAAAETAARLSPARRAFVSRVMAEGLDPRSAFHFGPYPHDVIRRIGPNVVEFETPAGEIGEGTYSRLAKNAEPIEGVAIMTSDDSVVALDVRLPQSERDLARRIIGALRRAPQYQAGNEVRQPPPVRQSRRPTMAKKPRRRSP